jgi:catechol 2,3-dioxygenase-like lactoylglutathione lyase family enzyme
MLDHVSLTVSDVGRAKAFYDAALAPLGITVLHAGPDGDGDDVTFAGYGSGGRAFFWIGGGWGNAGHAHVAFATDKRATVEAFYKAALAAGGRDNGAPGLRPHYDAAYYAAFVLDPDGHNIEAVTHSPA